MLRKWKKKEENIYISFKTITFIIWKGYLQYNLTYISALPELGRCQFLFPVKVHFLFSLHCFVKALPLPEKYIIYIHHFNVLVTSESYFMTFNEKNRLILVRKVRILHKLFTFKLIGLEEFILYFQIIYMSMETYFFKISSYLYQRGNSLFCLYQISSLIIVRNKF